VPLYVSPLQKNPYRFHLVNLIRKINLSNLRFLFENKKSIFKLISSNFFRFSPRFSEDPVEQLLYLVKSFERWNFELIELKVYTNSIETFKLLNQLTGSTAQNLCLLPKFINLQTLSHPYFLTWTHRKDLLEDYKLNSSNESVLYLYTEHDHLVQESNIDYFLNFKDQLSSLNYIPSFIQYEWNVALSDWTFVSPVKNSLGTYELLTKSLMLNGDMFIELKNPYCATWIMDNKMVEEFVTTEYWSYSERVNLESKLGVREMAASGLMIANLINDQKTRYLVKIDENVNLPSPGSQILHQGNTYARMPESPHSKLTFSEFRKIISESFKKN
jgi:hypothetical protein